jgi:hypothetical protein
MSLGFLFWGFQLCAAVHAEEGSREIGAVALGAEVGDVGSAMGTEPGVVIVDRAGSFLAATGALDHLDASLQTVLGVIFANHVYKGVEHGFSGKSLATEKVGYGCARFTHGVCNVSLAHAPFCGVQAHVFPQCFRPGWHAFSL